MSNRKEPLVSVIMSCYNAQRWLSESIESVLAQSFTEFEFIIIDDGSTDDTLEVVRKYEKKDPRITFFHKENSGLADSLNFGLSKSKGTWIARIDADDLCAVDRIKEQLSLANIHSEFVLIGSGCIEIDEFGNNIKSHLYPTNNNSLFYNLRSARAFFPHSSAFFLKKSAIDSGFYNVRFRSSQDVDMWLKLSKIGKIASVDKPLVKIRKHEQNISNLEGGLRQLKFGFAATVCYFLREYGAEDPSVGSDDCWNKFLIYVEKKLKDSGYFDWFMTWKVAREKFFFPGNTLLSGAVKAAYSLWSSDCFYKSLKYKFFGCHLAQKVAKEWLIENGVKCQ